MKKITFDDAFETQINDMKDSPGMTQEHLDMSFDEFKKIYNFAKNATEELITKMYKSKNFYSDGSEKKVGDKLIFYLIPTLCDDEKSFDMRLTSHVLDKIDELKDNDFYPNDVATSLPYVCEKNSKESKLLEVT